jgi:hypothetical protein
MKPVASKAMRAFARKGWLVVLPTMVILVLALVMTGTTSAASSDTPAAQPSVKLTQLLFQQQEPVCQSCHPEEYEQWKNTTHAKATLDPAFQEQLSKSHNQEACLACHTTGFDSASGHFSAEGVTCEACHGPYKEGHPKAETMQLPMESDTCRMCHTNAFTEWETSQHAANNIDCYDCHKAHTQGLRIEPQEKLCAACHSDTQTEAAHSVHGISGVDCASCHMAPQMKETASANGVEVPMSNHSFAVASDVCVRCHSDSAHAAKTDQALISSASQSTSAREAQQLELQTRRVAELEQQVNAQQKRIDDLRNIAIIGMALALGVGGFFGLVLGVGGAALLGRRKTQ